MGETDTQQPKFQRLDADARRRALIEATVRCLSKHGPRATSVREICAEAGVSPGLLRHYFEGKDELIARAYDYLTERLNGWTQTTLKDTGTPPETRLNSLFRHVLVGEWVNDEMLGVWIAFWSLQRNSDYLSGAHRSFNEDFREALGIPLGELADKHGIETDIRLASIGLSALIDGLWLEHCLNPQRFSGEEAVAMCQSWLDGFIGRDMHRHLRTCRPPAQDS